MRVLAIRGRNLASLAEPFEVDLAAGPLADAGLFAVTGETGAGKSTILDALCLALYGEYPRLAAGGREAAPDAGGASIGGRDPRAILRRGAGAGHAEVDFVGVDGVAYRARWEACRARGRAGGRLQPEARLLARLRDGAAVVDGKRDVLDAVERVTGLTFAQFRRTALLAQGEFDAFLLANDGDRAELLEKITGTDVYATTSVRVHEGAEARRHAVAALERRRADVGAADDAARAALEARASDARAALAGALAARDAAMGHLEGARRVAAARDALAEAERGLEAARNAAEAVAGDRDRVAAVEAVEPARAALVEVDAAAAELDAAVAAAAAAEAARAEADRRRSEAGDGLRAARDAHRAAASACEALEASWVRAGRLDADVAAARLELDAAAARAEASAREAERRRSGLDAAGRALAARSRERDGASTRLAARPDRALLVEQAGVAAALLADRRALDVERLALEAGLPGTEAELSRLAAATATATAELAAARGARDALAEEAATLRARLDGFDEVALAARGDELGALAFLLDRDATERLAHARARSAASWAAGRTRDAAEALVGLVRERERATSGRAAACAARGEVAALAELAEAAASEAAGALRAHLVGGAPCPVCGAEEHPFASSPSAADALVVRARVRRVELDAAVDRADAEAAAAATAVATAEAEARQAGEAGARASDDAGRLERARAERLPHLVERLRRVGIGEHAPDWADPDVEATARRLREVVEAARATTSAALAEAGRVRRDRDAVVDRRDAVAAAADAIAERLARDASARQRAEAALRRDRDRLGALRVETGRSDARLLPFLAAADMDAGDLADGVDEAGARLSALAAERAALAAEVATLDRDVAALDVARAGEAAAAEAARLAAEADDAASALRSSALAGAAEARAILLGGEATDAHRTRHEGSRDVTRDALAEAEATSRVADAADAAARATMAEAARARGAAERRLKVARGAAGELLAGLGSDAPAARGLLAVDREDLLRARGRVEAADRVARRAETARDLRRADLGRLGVEGGAPGDAAAAEAELSVAAARVDETNLLIGAVGVELARDDEARARLAGVDADLAAARLDLAAWADVDEAIGSAGGGKFRSIAQGVTLDHLVLLANGHLAALAPRYRLRRGAEGTLALHVVDLDMGEEARATRSLSGGERFLASLALALALAGLEGGASFVDTLFIDEGFGSLDAETLDAAVDALETLHGLGRKVGVVTHVAGMVERVAVQVRVAKRGGGRSVVEVTSAAGTFPA